MRIHSHTVCTCLGGLANDLENKYGVEGGKRKEKAHNIGNTTYLLEGSLVGIWGKLCIGAAGAFPKAYPYPSKKQN